MEKTENKWIETQDNFGKKINTVDKSLVHQEQVTDEYKYIWNECQSERMQSPILKIFLNNEGYVHIYGMTFIL